MSEINQSESGALPLFRPEQLPAKKTLSSNGLIAQRTIRNYSVLAGGIGFIPLARMTGQFAVGGVLVKLLGDLCRIYGIAFSDQQNKILVASILGGAHFDWVSRYLIKFVRGYTPVLHTPAAYLLRPAISGMLVYYIGRLFLVHFESGVWHATVKKKN